MLESLQQFHFYVPGGFGPAARRLAGVAINPQPSSGRPLDTPNRSAPIAVLLDGKGGEEKIASAGYCCRSLLPC